MTNCTYLAAGVRLEDDFREADGCVRDERLTELLHGRLLEPARPQASTVFLQNDNTHRYKVTNCVAAKKFDLASDIQNIDIHQMNGLNCHGS